MPHPSTTDRPPRSRRTGARLAGLALAVMATTGGVAMPGSTVAAASTPNSLTGVTINVADQFKQYETVFAATNALKGAPYTVSWSQFVGGPPIVAAETGGSVDLGDMAETPTIFAQAAGDPVKVVAAPGVEAQGLALDHPRAQAARRSRRSPSSAARPSPSRRAPSPSTSSSRS